MAEPKPVLVDRVKVGAGGRITIPKAMREVVKLQEGQELEIRCIQTPGHWLLSIAPFVAVLLRGDKA